MDQADGVDDVDELKSRIAKHVAVVFVLALLLRAAFFWIVGPVPNNDSIAYKQIAVNLVNGHSYSDRFEPPYSPALFRVPGYPAFLAAHYRLTPNAETWALATQILLGSLTCVAIYFLALRFLPPKVALVAGILAACNFVHIYLASCILAEVLFTFAISLFFLFALRKQTWKNPWGAFALGVLAATAILIRPTAGILAPIFAAAILLAFSGLNRARRLAVMLAFIAPIIAATQVWSYRNYRAGADWGLSAQKGYYMLWKAVRLGGIEPEGLEGDERLVAEIGGKNIEVFATGEILRNQHGFSYKKINALYRRIAIRAMLQKPVCYLAHSAFDFANCFLSPAIPARALAFAPINWSNAQKSLRQNRQEGNYGALALNYFLRAVFAALFFVAMPIGGHILWRKRSQTRLEQALLWICALATLGASALLAGGSDRFRAPMDPIFTVFIAAGLCRLAGWKPKEEGPVGPKPGTREFFDQSIERFERFARRNRQYHEEIARTMRFYLNPGDRVLEVGCGTGDLLAALAPQGAAGVDFSHEMVKRATRKYPQCRFIEADAHAFALNETFDIVVMSDLVGYLQDVQQAFENLHICMTPGSRLMVSFFNHLWEPVLKMAEALHLKSPSGIQNWLSLDDVVNLMRLAGFEPIVSGYRFLFPFRVPLLAPLFNRFIAKMPGMRKLCLFQYVIARPAPQCPPDWQTRYSVSVVIPTRNEVGNIAGAFERTPFMGKATELIFVDGNSTDGTVEEIERRMAAYRGPMTLKLIHQGTGRGKADAVRKGFDAATGDILMILDSDLTMPPEELPKYYRAIATGQAELVNGCRLVYPMESQAMRLINYAGNKFFGMAFSWLLGQPIRDTLCGTKVLSRADYEKIKRGRVFFGDFDPFGDFDLLFGAARIARKIVDLPIRYRDRTYGDTKINRWRHGWLLIQMCGIAFVRFKLN